jgi:hypothetical protein
MKTIKLEKVHLVSFKFLYKKKKFLKYFLKLKIHENPAVIMEKVLKEHDVPEDKQVRFH